MIRARGWEDRVSARASSMTPCIDVIFNLLIFVLCTSQIRSSEAVVESRLPREVDPAVLESPRQPQRLRIELILRGEVAEVYAGGGLLGRAAVPPGLRSGATGSSPGVARVLREWDEAVRGILSGPLRRELEGALADPELQVSIRADGTIPYDLVARCEDEARYVASRLPARRAAGRAVEILYELPGNK